MEKNEEILVDIKKACENLQKHEAQGMAQLIANCLQWPVNIKVRGSTLESVITILYRY